jgi:hypothetical protein
MTFAEAFHSRDYTSVAQPDNDNFDAARVWWKNF